MRGHDDPSQHMKATVRLEHAFLAVEADHEVHAMLELSAPEVTSQQRPRLDLALVIDRSGSMAGDKLEVTRACAAFLVRRLRPTDQFALIDYDDEVRLLAPLAAVGPVQGAVMAAINGIRPGGQTNLSGGWLKGVEELNRATDESVKRVLLLTDGLANVGVTDSATLASMTGAAAGEGAATTTIGFGEGFNEDLLTAMADAGGGNAHWAGTPDEAPAIFADEFEGLVSLVAQNVSVEVRPGPEVSVVEVLNEFPTIAVPGGVQVALGDAYSGEQRRVVFSLLVPALAHLGPAKVADAIVRYTAVGTQVAMHELTLPVMVNLLNADGAASAPVDAEVTEEVLVLKAARAQDEAKRLADSGEFDKARRLLAQVARDLREKVPGSAKAEELAAHAAQLEEAETFMSRAAFSPAARKTMHYRTREMRGRTTKRPKG